MKTETLKEKILKYQKEIDDAQQGINEAIEQFIKEDDDVSTQTVPEGNPPPPPKP